MQNYENIELYLSDLEDKLKELADTEFNVDISIERRSDGYQYRLQAYTLPNIVSYFGVGRSIEESTKDLYLNIVKNTHE
jgi:hypothetical protein